MSTYRKYHIMLKRILLSIVLLLITVYLGVAVTVFNRKPADQVCLSGRKKDGAHTYENPGKRVGQASAYR